MSEQVIEASRAYPNITRLTLDMVGYNGGLHVMRNPAIGASAEIESLLNEFLGANVVHARDIAALDGWLGGLSADDFMIVADGEEREMAALLAHAPAIGGQQAADFIDSLYEYCI